MTHDPTHGWTKHGRAVHANTMDHLPKGNAAARFNTKLAVGITNVVGSMWCAYVFCLIALAGLPTALHPGGEGIVAWIAQTFLQLVLLAVIMVGQSVQSAASDARAGKTFEDVEFVMNQVNEHTDGGLKTVLDRLDALEKHPEPAEPKPAPRKRSTPATPAPKRGSERKPK
jgi:hypothetical protein